LLWAVGHVGAWPSNLHRNLVTVQPGRYAVGGKDGQDNMARKRIKGPKPHVVSMIICDLVLRDQTTRNVSLIGLFNAIHGLRLPMLHDRLHVFISLTEGRGRMPFSLLCKAPDETVISETRGEIVFGNPLEVTDVDVELRGLVFQTPGLYRFEFECGSELALRRFSVLATSDAASAPPPEEPSDS
jgi:hypothetical protein